MKLHMKESGLPDNVSEFDPNFTYNNDERVKQAYLEDDIDCAQLLIFGFDIEGDGDITEDTFEEWLEVSPYDVPRTASFHEYVESHLEELGKWRLAQSDEQTGKPSKFVSVNGLVFETPYGDYEVF